MRRRHASSLVLITGAAILVSFGVLIRGIDRCGGGVAGPLSLAAIDRTGTLSLSGPITPDLVAQTRRTLRDGKTPVHRVSLNSTGGENAAMAELVAMLVPLKAPFSVGPGATCQSACIGLLAEAARGIEIDPTATLMFHASAVRIGLATRGPCGWLNAVTIRLTQPFRDSADMLPWARTLNPKLPTLFDACHRNPLTTLEGITLTGREFNELREGAITVQDLLGSCPSA